MTTQRQISIMKMFAIMDSVSYSGGDWDDHLAAQVEAIPSAKKLPGITQEELSTIDEAYSCPRMVSDFLSDMADEIEGVEEPQEVVELKFRLQSLKAAEKAAKVARLL
jgi:hypothetical protein